MDAIPIKLDALASLTRQLGTEIQTLIASVTANTESNRLFANAMETQAQTFRELVEEITAEPDEADSLGDLLRDIHHLCTLIYARLPAPAGKP